MERSAPGRKRRLSSAQLLIGLFLLGAVVGVVGAVTDKGQGDASALFLWLVIATMPVALWLTLLWWRRLDEAAREAHKWAWYWGATGGVLIVIPLLFLPEAMGVVELAHRLDFVEPFELVSFGMFAVLILQVLGYGIAWAAWWLKRR
jgi:hypothetical protein